MFKDYYKSLQLPRTATSEEIKRSYRKLAKKYHPDSNPDPKAKPLFQEINEAHQTLGDERKRIRYNRTYDYYQVKGKPPPVFYHTYQQARKAYRPKPRKEPVSNTWKNFARYSITCVWASFILILAMMCDQALAPEKERAMISKVRFSVDALLVETNTTDFFLDKEYAGLLGKGMEIDIHFTPLFHVLNRIRIFPDIEEEELQPLFPNNPVLFRPHANVYGGIFWFMVSFMVLIFIIIPKKDPVYVACGNTFIGVLGIMLVFILFSSRGLG